MQTGDEARERLRVQPRVYSALVSTNERYPVVQRNSRRSICSRGAVSEAQLPHRRHTRVAVLAPSAMGQQNRAKTIAAWLVFSARQNDSAF